MKTPDSASNRGGRNRRRGEPIAPETLERQMREAQAVVDRSRNLRQAITLQRVLRALRRTPRGAGGLDGRTDSPYHA